MASTVAARAASFQLVAPAHVGQLSSSSSIAPVAPLLSARQRSSAAASTSSYSPLTVTAILGTGKRAAVSH